MPRTASSSAIPSTARSRFFSPRMAGRRGSPRRLADSHRPWPAKARLRPAAPTWPSTAPTTRGSRPARRRRRACCTRAIAGARGRLPTRRSSPASPRARSRWRSATPATAWSSAAITRRKAEAIDNLAVTSDGGRTWTLVKARGLSGFRSVVAYVPGTKMSVIAVGPQGADWSDDDGRTWTPVAGTGFHTFSFSASGRVGFGAGGKGGIGRLDIDRR